MLVVQALSAGVICKHYRTGVTIMAKTDWTGIRIRRSTLAEMKKIMATLTIAYEQGKYEAKQRHDRLITLDDVIVELIRRDGAKRERARKSANGRKRPDVQALDTSAVLDG
jgi:oligoribonuclease NrnB/cAMP/cGMP phosphodiesterase (DHH superfamily)